MNQFRRAQLAYDSQEDPSMNHSLTHVCTECQTFCETTTNDSDVLISVCCKALAELD